MTVTPGIHITHNKDQGERGMGLAADKGMDHFVILLAHELEAGSVMKEFTTATDTVSLSLLSLATLRGLRERKKSRLLGFTGLALDS